MSTDLALDFGTSYIKVADASGTLVFEEPSIAALDADSKRVLCIGTDAWSLRVASAGRVRVTRLVRAGQLLDLELAGTVLETVLRRLGASRVQHPRVLVTTHVGATGVQRRAMERSLRSAGARQVSFLEQPVAAAIGAGLPIEEPTGQMVLDLGGGTTDICVLALGGMVSSCGLSLGGDDFDAAVRALLTRRYRIVVDSVVAEATRRAIGTVSIGLDHEIVNVEGRDARTGAPRSVELAASELGFVLSELVRPILDAAIRTITAAPPDLANDLLSQGLVLCGGASALKGFDQRLARATGVPVHVVSEGGRLAVLGAAACLGGSKDRVLALSGARNH